MEGNKKASVLISIFRRKGGEGVYTKVITDQNKNEYEKQFINLKSDEIPILCYKQNEFNWVLLTDARLIEAKNGEMNTLFYNEINSVDPALHEEFKDKVINKDDFTRLAIKDLEDKIMIIKLEKGLPYRGIYQVLYFAQG